MNKKISHIRNSYFLKDFFKSKKNLFINSFSLIALIVCYFIFYQKEPLVFFPENEDIIVDFYNDSLDNGISIIKSTDLSDSSAVMHYILKEGFLRPYVGIGFADSMGNEFDISHFNRVKIEIAGQGISSVFAYLMLTDTVSLFEGTPLGYRPLCKYFEINPNRESYRLLIRNFSEPDWWFDKYNLSPAKINKPDWKKMHRVALATGLTPEQNIEQSISIYSIIFYRSNVLVILFMVLIQLSIFALTMLNHRIKAHPKKKSNTLTINYHAVKLEPSQSSNVDFLDYINKNFSNSALSLQLISKQTSVSQRKIAQTISSQYQCNVKTYINMIRINEAQRLLKESNLHSSEIAYRVGFSSPSNFNRVFKNLTGQSPTEFLQRN